MVELLFGHGPNLFFSAGSVSAGGQTEFRCQAVDKPQGPDEFLTLGTGPGHIITLSDSNFQKTIATANNRPSNDPNDAFIGYDQGDGNPANIGISFGAPQSISNYIGNVGDGKKWLERLSAKLKMFTVPISIPSVAPAHANDPCITGTETWDANFIYVCVAKNTWKRAPLASW